MATKSDQADTHGEPIVCQKVRAAVGSELTPDYFSLHEKDFEEFCAALFELESHLCDVTRVDPAGRPQYGVDVRAHCRDWHGEEVISCKREARIGKQKIIDWSNDFLRHWKSKWKAIGVRRFVLAVAEPISKGEAFEQVDIERKRFARKHIKYEVWGPVQLTNRARGRPSILAQFYHPDWAAKLSEGAATAQTVEIHLLVSQGQSLSTALAQSTHKRIEIAREGFRKGDWQGLDRELSEICDDVALWRELPSTERALIWQLRAERLLFQDRLDEAAKAIIEVERHDGSAIGLLRAQLTATRGDVATAIDLLMPSTDATHRRMRAQFRLAQGDVEGALTDLDKIDSSDVDVQRLRAISLLVADQSVAAWSALRAAQTIASDNYWVRHTEMRLCYDTALAPITPGRASMTPVPVHLLLIREDVDALAALDRCAEIAGSLALLRVDPEERRELKLWRLAALCLHPDRRNVANAVAQELLAESEPLGALVPWLLTYDLTFEPQRIEHSLIEALKSARPHVEHLGGLLVLFQAANRQADALGLLNEFAPFFPAHSALTESWRNRLQASSRPLVSLEMGECCELVATAPDANNVIAWIRACESLVSQQRWADLVPAVAPLLEVFASAPATAIALQIVSETDGPAAFLNLLEQHHLRFHGAHLPHGLRQCRINALTKLGRLVVAQTEALALACENLDVIDRLNAIAVSHHLGDDTTILQQARALTPNALDAHNALRMAHTLSTIDPSLARRFWDHAWSLGVPDEHAPEAAILGIQLEVGSSLRQVMQQFQRYAASGVSDVVTAHSLDEVVRFLTAHRAQNEQLHAQWRSGLLPIHALTTNLGELVTAWYHFFHATPRRVPSWYIHSGARLNRPAAHPQALVLDTTGLLSAWHLELMGQLEQCGIPILLSPSLPQVLKSAKDSLLPHQPGAVRARSRVVEAIDASRIQVAANSTWLHVGFFIEGHPRPGANLRWLAETLGRAGTIDREQLEVLIDRLGTYGEELVHGPGDDVTEIIVDAGALCLIAEGSELNALLNQFTVAITIDDATQLRSENQSDREQEAIVANLEALNNRILEGLHAGRYRLLERNYRNGAVRHKRDASLLLQAAFELLELEVPEGAWLWFDDRLFHSLTDSPVPSVSSVDVLRWLKELGQVSAAHEIRLRRKLFAAGAAFVALEVDEVIDALVHPDTLLPLLAQAHLRGAQEASALRLAAATEQPVWSESAYSFRELTLVSRVIGRLWADSSIPDDIASTRAAQAWSAFGYSWWSADETACTAQIAKRILMFQLAGLLLDPVMWALDSKVRFKRMDAYGKWLDQFLIQPSIERNPGLTQLLIDHLVPFVCQLLAVSDSHADENRVFATNVTRWLTCWPEFLRSSAFANATLRARLAVEPQRWVNIGEGHVSVAEFASAIALALAEGQAEIAVLPTGNRANIVVSRATGHLPKLAVEGDAHYSIDDDAYLLASPITDDRSAALRAHPEYWEAQHTSVDEAMRTLYGCSEPLTRLDRVEAMREQSPAYRYLRLSTLVNAHESVQMDEFLPTNVSAQLAYLRLHSADIRPWAQRVNDAAETLIATVGLSNAIRRYAAFPCDLPFPLVKAVEELDDICREALIGELSDSASPMHRVHGILLSLRNGVSRPGAVADWIKTGKAAMDELVQGYGWLLAEFVQSDLHFADDARIAAWSHLGSLLHALPNGVDLKLLQTLGRKNKAKILRAHLRSRKPSGDLLDFDSVLRPRQLFAATLCACTRLGPLAALDLETSAQVQAQLSIVNNDIALPHPELLPRMLTTNMLDSWLALPFSELAQALDWPLLAGYDEELTRNFRAHALEELEKDPDSPEAWKFSINIAPATDWDTDAKKRILAVATKTDPVTLRSRSEERLWPEIVNLLIVLCSTDDEARANTERFLHPSLGSGDQPLHWVEPLLGFHARDDIHGALQGVASWLLCWAESVTGSEKYVRQVLDVLESFVSVDEAGPLRQVRLKVGFV